MKAKKRCCAPTSLPAPAQNRRNRNSRASKLLRSSSRPARSCTHARATHAPFLMTVVLTNLEYRPADTRLSLREREREASFVEGKERCCAPTSLPAQNSASKLLRRPPALHAQQEASSFGTKVPQRGFVQDRWKLTLVRRGHRVLVRPPYTLGKRLPRSVPRFPTGVLSRTGGS